MRIPFNRYQILGNEIKYIKEAIASGHISGDGKFTNKCNSYFEKFLGVKKCLLTTSCTDALEMAALLIGLKPGDEIIVPSFTFVSTINAFVLRGAKPIFIDIRSDTLNLDETQLENLITDKTKAIVPVHYAGVGCEMNTIMDIANHYKIPVVEDNAHGLFGKYKGKYLGTFGTFSTQSFHETKNISCGEGGSLNINDSKYITRAEIIREKGTNRSRFFRGMVDKYTWVDIGSSFLPSDILAAILYAQLEQHDKTQAKRKMIWEYYNENLKDWAHKNSVGLPNIPENCDQAYHMFYLIMSSHKQRSALIEHLKENDIMAVFHYLPLHLSDMGEKFGYKIGEFPVTEKMSEYLIRLPFFNNISENDLLTVVDTVNKFQINK